MTLLALSESLQNTDEASKILQQISKHISTASKASVKREAQHAERILQNFLQFCKSSSSDYKNQQLCTMLSIIHRLNEEDSWLLAASTFILPSLNKIYCEVLAHADPTKKSRPGSFNVSITPPVQKDMHALRALCAVFELCIDFCDVVTKHVEKYLQLFLRMSAAVLFGSNFQKESLTLNATDYAMDELARHSSFALSNILLTYPQNVSVAAAILGKRINALFNFLLSSPELSVQRSLVIILRVLHDYGSDGMSGEIKKFLSSDAFGGVEAVKSFDNLDLSFDDISSGCEAVISRIFDGATTVERCFKMSNCSVQIKEKHSKRAVFRMASIDWNKNSIVVHLPNQTPHYLPIFSISEAQWVKGYSELQLIHNDIEDKHLPDVVIRFKGKSGDHQLHKIIEKRLESTIALVSGDENFTAGAISPFTDRKVSTVVLKTMEVDDNQTTPIGPAEKKTKSFPTPKITGSGQRTVFSNMPIDGILLVNRERIPSRSALSSLPGSNDDTEPICEEVKKRPEELVSDSENGITLPSNIKLSRNEKKNGPTLQKKEQDKSDTNLKVPDPKENRDDAMEVDRGALIDVEQQVHSLGKENGPNGGGKEQCTFASPMPSGDDSNIDDDGPYEPSGDESEKSDVDAANPCEGLERGEAMKNSRKQKFNDDFIMRTEYSTLHGTPGSEVPSISQSCPPSPGSKTGFIDEIKRECQHEQELKQKMRSIVQGLIEIQNKRSQELMRKAKKEVVRLREKAKRDDKELVSKFSDMVSKKAAMQRRMIRKNTLQRGNLLKSARERLDSMMGKLEDCKMKLEKAKENAAQKIEQSTTQMNEIRDELDNALQGCIDSGKRRKNCKSRNDSLFQELAKLLHES